MIEQAWVVAGAAVAAAGAGWWAAINGSRTLKRAREDSRARSRPMVAAELRAVPYVKGTQILVIRNYGPTLAYNVRVTFDPPIPDPPAEKAAESMTPFLKRRYGRPIPVLTPGVELDNVWFSGRPGANDQWENAELTPSQFTVTIAYDDTSGHSYEDKFPLDVAILRARTTTTSSEQPDQLLKKAAKNLRNIDTALTRIARSIPVSGMSPQRRKILEDLEERLASPGDSGT